jgi:hypothetical protein
MKIHLIIIFLLLTVSMSIAVFAQGMNASETIESTVQKIAATLRDVSPILLIGLGILLIFIQKFAKIVGIILLVIGIVRLVFLFL